MGEKGYGTEEVDQMSPEIWASDGNWRDGDEAGAKIR